MAPGLLSWSVARGIPQDLRDRTRGSSLAGGVYIAEAPGGALAVFLDVRVFVRI